MRFEDFAAAHGLLLRHVEFGKWVRVPTEDHPQKKNGSYKHLGSHAYVQNHATMTECATWFPEGDNDASSAGEIAAKRSGRSWIMSAMQGEDANDWHRRLGTFRFAQELRKELARI